MSQIFFLLLSIFVDREFREISFELCLQAISFCSAYIPYNVSVAPSRPVTAAPGAPTFGVNATTGATVQCDISGRNITVSSNTTCSALSTIYNVSTFDVQYSNPNLVNADCSITAPATICLPQACTLYTIQTNDTCQSVAAKSGVLTGTNITTTQLQSFNPELGTYCQVMALMVGQPICVTPNGGFPTVAGGTTLAPSATPTTYAPLPSSTAPGSTSSCGRWYLVQTGQLSRFC